MYIVKFYSQEHTPDEVECALFKDKLSAIAFVEIQILDIAKSNNLCESDYDVYTEDYYSNDKLKTNMELKNSDYLYTWDIIKVEFYDN